MSQAQASCDPSITQETEAFAQRMLDMLNQGALAVMTSIGHRLGLFDTLATLPPASSADIAASAGLNERYVREWLAALTTARVVCHDPSSQTYWLPDAHAALLTRAASPNNLAVYAQSVAMLGQIVPDILPCFRDGGGLAYHCYPEFHRIMAEDSEQTVVSALETQILSLAPELPARLEAGIRVLDVGCGEGRALIRMAGLFPRSEFRGYDLCAEAIDTARQEATRQGLGNIHFETRDTTHLDEVQRYQLITTFDAVHDQKDPARVLQNIHRALAPDGVYLMQDIAGSSRLENNLDHPVGTLLYTISCLHCMSVSLAQGGEGLGTLWGEEQAMALLRGTGFGDIQIRRLAHDFMNVYFICRRRSE